MIGANIDDAARAFGIVPGRRLGNNLNRRDRRRRYRLQQRSQLLLLHAGRLPVQHDRYISFSTDADAVIAVDKNTRRPFQKFESRTARSQAALPGREYHLPIFHPDSRYTFFAHHHNIFKIEIFRPQADGSQHRVGTHLKRLSYIRLIAQTTHIQHDLPLDHCRKFALPGGKPLLQHEPRITLNERIDGCIDRSPYRIDNPTAHSILPVKPTACDNKKER